MLDMDGNVLEGESDPAPEIKTHLEIYKAFTGISGVVNTVSPYAVAWAQAKRDIPCYGAIHAKRFYGAVPCTRLLKKEELSDFDLVLVDTAGRSHNNHEQQEDIGNILRTIPEGEREVFLVLSATTKYRDLVNISKAYSEICKYNLILHL